MDGTTGEVKMFAGTFAPKGWAFCHGQLLPTASYSPLFSIVGTTYGGDGRTTFALPDLRSRVPRGAGERSGLTDTQLGKKGGSEETRLTVQNLPPHTHDIEELKLKESMYYEQIQRDDFNEHYISIFEGTDLAESAKFNTVKSYGTTTSTGIGAGFDNNSPYLGINFIICLNGIFPSRT